MRGYIEIGIIYEAKFEINLNLIFLDYTKVEF